MPLLFKSRKAAVAPRRIPAHADVPVLADAEIAAVYCDCRIAGDFYDFIRVSPDRVLFGLLDVSGHLEETRAIISSAQQAFRSRAVELFAPEDINEADAMIDLCLVLNRTVIQAAGRICTCPAFAGCYNESSGIVSYFNAGHTPALVHDAAGITQLEATGVPLGLFSHLTYDANMVALAPGSRLLAVSRGVVEAKHKKEEFGLDRVSSYLQETREYDPHLLCTGLLDRLADFMRTPPKHDDATALALTRPAN